MSQRREDRRHNSGRTHKIRLARPVAARHHARQHRLHGSVRLASCAGGEFLARPQAGEISYGQGATHRRPPHVPQIFGHAVRVMVPQGGESRTG